MRGTCAKYRKQHNTDKKAHQQGHYDNFSNYNYYPNQKKPKEFNGTFYGNRDFFHINFGCNKNAKAK